MDIINARNPRATDSGQIILDVLFQGEQDYIEFVADPNDLTSYGPVLHQRALAGDFGVLTQYVPPAAPIPTVVSRRQGRLALLGAGKLDTVEANIEAITDPAQKRAAQIEYESDTWERSNAFLQSMWTQLGGTEAELDALFTTAAGL